MARDEDGGSTHVLEAVLVVSIMISAVAFVVTFDAPNTAAGESREGLEVKAEDALAILHDTPLDSRFGSDALSAFIAECLNGQCGNLSRRLDDLVPEGASYALYVSNGFETYPVLLEGTPHGEAVTAVQPFEPRWSSTFLATATDAIDADDSLLVYALPIFHSNPISPGGSQLLVKLTGTRTDSSDYVLIGSYATIAQAASDPAAVSASLYFVDAAGEPLAVHDLTLGEEADSYRLTLRLKETEGGILPAGTEVAVHLPRGFTAEAPQAANPTWTVLSSATDANGALYGSTLRANLTAPLTNAHADLAFDLTYHGDALDHYPIVATLSKGATSTASLLLRADEHDTEPALATPILQMSVPSPMGSGAPTTWTLSAYVPVGSPVGEVVLPDSIQVSKVEIIEKEGNDIFACDGGAPVESLTEDAGIWTCAADSLVWEGRATLDYDSVLNLSFRVNASGIAGPNDARSAFLPPVQFDSFTGRLVERTGWGFYKQAILPEDETYAGFENTVADGHIIRSDGPYRSTPLPGSTSYNVTPLAAIKDSLYGSYVTTQSRNVPVGGEVVINANVQSVLFTLAEVGQRAGVTLRFYPPWSGDARVPIYEQENLDQGLLNGEVTKMVVLDINGDGAPDPIVGTSNGRVIAFHGLTGQRLQGNSFTPPLAPGVEISGAAQVTALSTITFGGEDYIVVGFDGHPNGNLYVLDTDLSQRWYSPITDSIAAVDADVDIDRDGDDDIVAMYSYLGSGGATRARVYAFALDPDPDEDTLQVIETPTGETLADVLGTPTTVAGVQRLGPRGEEPGILVPIQTLYDPSIIVDPSSDVISQGSGSTPRAGVQASNRLGEMTSTLFGAPASVIHPYDYGGDAIDDVAFGGTSGYVIMANGTVLTQPIYSYLNVNTALVDSDTKSSTESYAITLDGTVIFTDDAWITQYYSTSQLPGASGISSNSTWHYWVVGPANSVWRSSIPAATAPDHTLQRHPATRDFGPVTLTNVVRGTAPGVDEAYDMVLHLHDLRDVWAEDATITIVGTRCGLLLVECNEPIILRSTDEGASWRVLTLADGSLVGADGGMVTQDLNRIEFMRDGTGWIVGDGGVALRSTDGGATWDGVATGTTADLLDIDCMPGDADTCLAVGAAGATFRIADATGATPEWTEITGEFGLPADVTKDFFTVAYVEDDRIYIGTTNMMLASFWGANFTALPMNYLENTVYSVSTAGDGSGFAFGGTPVNFRQWLLHDYATESRAVTTSFAEEFPPDAAIYQVVLTDTNVTLGQQTVEINVTRGAEWKTMGTLSGIAAEDERKLQADSFVTFDQGAQGRDLRFNITMNTSGEKTILSPHIRSLTFQVDYMTGGAAASKAITLDFATTARRDATLTTADWNTSAAVLRQPLVREYWTRNVTGEVMDIQSGFDLTGDGRSELWVATGDVLAENSPDHLMYQGTARAPDDPIGADDRVYLLDGRNGNTTRISQRLPGEVSHVRLVDRDGNDHPETLFATTWNATLAEGRLYALNATTLDVLWYTTLGAETPMAAETGHFAGGDAAAFVGTMRPVANGQALGHLWAVNATTHEDQWKIIADDMGKYVVAAEIPKNWLFGAYVVEIEVEWEETVTEGGAVGQEVLRSARFYDHFMVTPPDALSPPAPVYSAKLLVWMQDWT